MEKNSQEYRNLRAEFVEYLKSIGVSVIKKADSKEPIRGQEFSYIYYEEVSRVFGDAWDSTIATRPTDKKEW